MNSDLQNKKEFGCSQVNLEMTFGFKYDAVLHETKENVRIN